MTISESQPRTRAGRDFIHELGFAVDTGAWVQDRVLAIEAEAAQDSLPSPAPEPPPALSRGKGKGKEWGEGYSEGWFDASAGFGLAAFFDWAARSPHYSCSMEDEPEGTSRGVHLWHIYRKYHGAAQPAPDLDPIRHALEYVSKALDKASDGDSVEGDLLEVHATLDSFLEARESGGEP